MSFDVLFASSWYFVFFSGDLPVYTWYLVLFSVIHSAYSSVCRSNYLSVCTWYFAFFSSVHLVFSVSYRSNFLSLGSWYFDFFSGVHSVFSFSCRTNFCPQDLGILVSFLSKVYHLELISVHGFFFTISHSRFLSCNFFFTLAFQSSLHCL
ncbi:unnamed protein product [Psylliodes chrysocephalus]|uniref:Uncharacterized protein n=1 Tax=Psylliodes chrysocephalus TaxID=3402493 RepID=A0A9P0CT55_9CUCU|nr:unnamed protein product [Psylliodes chrysocephala]